MKLTALDIQQQQFRTRFRGFDIREVDAFLDLTADSFAQLLAENDSLRDRIDRLEHELLGYKQREETFKKAMLNSQQAIDQMKKNAQQSADLVVAEAEVKAEKILNNAHQRLGRLQEDIEELKRQRVQIEAQIRSILDGHSRLLEMGVEASKARDQEDTKVQVLKKT